MKKLTGWDLIFGKKAYPWFNLPLVVRAEGDGGSGLA